MKKVMKPWGGEVHFVRNEKCTVKILIVRPGQRLSLQRHKYRRENWYFLTDGYAQVGRKTLGYKKGDLVKVGKNRIHRLVAKKKAVEVLEISRGKFLQGDEVRLEDDYGRD